MCIPTNRLIRTLTAALSVSVGMVLVLSCGKGGNNRAPTGLLSGNWEMTLQPDLSSTTTETEAGFLLQTNHALTGELLLSAQSECAGLGSVQGTVNGSNVVITLDQMGQTVSLTGVASNDGSSIAGTYSILGSSCAGSSSAGKWTASPVKPVTGNYQATFTSNNVSVGSYVFALNVTQAPNAGLSTTTISGTMTSTTAPCARTVSIAGVVSGTSIVFNFLASDGSTALGQFRGATSVDATTLTGTYDFLANTQGCAGDAGTISIVQQASS